MGEVHLFAESPSRKSPRALRAMTKKSNPPPQVSPNQFSANSPAIPSLIKIRCAKMSTKAHHPASLTEEDDAQWQLLHPWRSLVPPRLGVRLVSPSPPIPFSPLHF